MYDFWDIQSYICFSLLLMLFAGKVLLMLDKVQFELQKLVDNYVSAYYDVVNCSLAFHILFQKWVQPDINLLFLYFSAQIYSQQSRTLQNLSSMNFGQLRSVLVDFVCLAYILDLSPSFLYAGDGHYTCFQVWSFLLLVFVGYWEPICFSNYYFHFYISQEQ